MCLQKDQFSEHHFGLMSGVAEKNVRVVVQDIRTDVEIQDSKMNKSRQKERKTKRVSHERRLLLQLFTREFI